MSVAASAATMGRRRRKLTLCTGTLGSYVRDIMIDRRA